MRRTREMEGRQQQRQQRQQQQLATHGRYLMLAGPAVPEEQGQRAMMEFQTIAWLEDDDLGKLHP